MITADNGPIRSTSMVGLHAVVLSMTAPLPTGPGSWSTGSAIIPGYQRWDGRRLPTAGAPLEIDPARSVRSDAYSAERKRPHP